MEDKMKRLVILSLVLLLCSFGTAFSAPVQWSVEDGGNGNWYEIIRNPDAWGVWTWEEANTAASSATYAGMQGHLVTITTQDENDFVSSSAFLGSAYGGLFAETIWIGGYQDEDATELDEGWHWVTGEEWSYTHWNSTQPNGLADHYLAMASGAITPASGWYDMPVGAKFWNDENVAYIIEYEASSQVPVPGSMLLLGAGLIGMAAFSRKKSA